MTADLASGSNDRAAPPSGPAGKPSYVSALGRALGMRPVVSSDGTTIFARALPTTTPPSHFTEGSLGVASLHSTPMPSVHGPPLGFSPANGEDVLQGLPVSTDQEQSSVLPVHSATPSTSEERTGPSGADQPHEQVPLGQGAPGERGPSTVVVEAQEGRAEVVMDTGLRRRDRMSSHPAHPSGRELWSSGGGALPREGPDCAQDLLPAETSRAPHTAPDKGEGMPVSFPQSFDNGNSQAWRRRQQQVAQEGTRTVEGLPLKARRGWVRKARKVSAVSGGSSLTSEKGFLQIGGIRVYADEAGTATLVQQQKGRREAAGSTKKLRKGAGVHGARAMDEPRDELQDVSDEEWETDDGAFVKGPSDVSTDDGLLEDYIANLAVGDGDEDSKWASAAARLLRSMGEDGGAGLGHQEEEEEEDEADLAGMSQEDLKELHLGSGLQEDLVGEATLASLLGLTGARMTRKQRKKALRKAQRMGLVPSVGTGDDDAEEEEEEDEKFDEEEEEEEDDDEEEEEEDSDQEEDSDDEEEEEEEEEDWEGVTEADCLAAQLLRAGQQQPSLRSGGMAPPVGGSKKGKMKKGRAGAWSKEEDALREWMDEETEGGRGGFQQWPIGGQASKEEKASKKKKKKEKKLPPGEKKRMRLEGIATKRAQRMEMRGFNIRTINSVLERMVVENELDMLTLPPMEKDERAQVHKLAAIYRLKSVSTGNGKKRFTMVIRTDQTTAVPATGDRQRLQQMLERTPPPAGRPRKMTAAQRDAETFAEHWSPMRVRPRQQKGLSAAAQRDLETFGEWNGGKGRGRGAANGGGRADPWWDAGEDGVWRKSSRGRGASLGGRRGGRGSMAGRGASASGRSSYARQPMEFVSSGVMNDTTRVRNDGEDPADQRPATGGGRGRRSPAAGGGAGRGRGGGGFNREESEVILSSSTFTTTNEMGFGDFEAHTLGFGSRMLAKMGFQAGEGLGRAGQGIATPVEAVRRPKMLGLGAD
eukprot:TRINITY_DN265_c1_g2_i1.p1 TRINITY_DN265_c1_g2~~TRINITY_DN265_c1_g2_i1.p1  ORF type:complete len:1011 (+),score=292.58 TRINITY_DN265_c1_g2_i1:81-3035(+)